MNRVVVTRNPMGGYAAFEMQGDRVFAVNVARTPQMLADMQFSAAYPVGTVFRWVIQKRNRKTWRELALAAAVKLWRRVR